MRRPEHKGNKLASAQSRQLESAASIGSRRIGKCRGVKCRKQTFLARSSDTSAVRDRAGRESRLASCTACTARQLDQEPSMHGCHL